MSWVRKLSLRLASSEVKKRVSVICLCLLHIQLSATMKRLCKEAMQKIISLIDEDTASLRLQVSVCQRDNQVLKENLQVMDGDLRSTGGLGEVDAEDRKTQGKDLTKFVHLSEVNSGTVSSHISISLVTNILNMNRMQISCYSRNVASLC